MSGRVYVRKFDWDEARRLRAEGMTYRAIAERLGVSIKSVWFACDARARNLSRNYNAEYQRSGRCIDCGAQISRNASQPVLRCLECAALAKTTTVRDNALWCCGCKTWKHDNEFPYTRAKNREHRRGRHTQCRPCLTVERQAYRERHKVPCVDCGTPCLPPGQKGSHGSMVPRCRSCANRESWRRRKEAR